MPNIIGIDLGTTNSAVAIVRDCKPQLLDYYGERLLPSVVGFTSSGQWVVGTPARNQFGVRPENTVRSIKREMGKDFRIAIGDKTFTPPEISAFILREIKRIAENALGGEVSDAVITVPAYFSDAQRLATQEAGRIAGLNVRRIINEPTAAALAYGLNGAEDQLVLIYDLGGGTFDVSLVELMDGVVEVLASHGDTQLGGDDFDKLLAELLADRFQEENDIDPREDRRAWARLLDAAERAKIALSSRAFVTVKEEYLLTHAGIPRHLETEVSRADLDELTRELLLKTLDSVEIVLKDADISAEQIDHVLLVGGSTRMPAVRALIEDELGMEPHDTINPDEAVALGAAVQAAIIDGQPIDAILVDVTPYSLGIAVAEVVMDRLIPDRYKILIPRNTTIPTTKEERFYTLHPTQTAIQIEVYQGEEPIASRNTSLGDFMVENLHARVPGMPAEITVQFDFDVNGRLTVTARDRATGNAVDMTVDAPVVRLNERGLLDSQKRVADMSQELVTVSADMAALIDRAQRLMAAADMDGDGLDRLSELLEQIRAARVSGETEDLAELQEELLDLLFDLEM
jgi:molecular chaperone DnaK